MYVQMSFLSTLASNWYLAFSLLILFLEQKQVFYAQKLVSSFYVYQFVRTDINSNRKPSHSCIHRLTVP